MIVGGPFACILADPPWKFVTRSEKGLGRSPDRHYSTMGMADICAIPVAEHAADDCHLFLWVTKPILAAGLHLPVMKAWGFEPSTVAFDWLKTAKWISGNGRLKGYLTESLFPMGLGHTTRANAEYVVLGRRGSPVRLRKDIHSVVLAPRREHSRKPDALYERIEAYCPGPRLELFARTQRRGWVTAFSDEAGMFRA